MHRQAEVHALTLDRRRFLQSAGGVAVAAGMVGTLAWPRNASADQATASESPLPQPRPIAGGIQIPGGPLIHVFAPGPSNVTLPFSGTTLQGFDVDPSPITDRAGFSALAFHVGKATGSDGQAYNLETDIRAFKIRYVAADGTRPFGTFAFI
jgi:hypothetical protein